MPGKVWGSLTLPANISLRCGNPDASNTSPIDQYVILFNSHIYGVFDDLCWFMDKDGYRSGVI
jgi:hypothetical protein